MSIKSDAIARLFDAYDKRPTPGKLFYYTRWADGLPANEVDRIIDQAVMEYEYIPKISQLVKLTSQRKEAKAEDGPTEECWLCDGSGLIMGAWKNDQSIMIDGVISRCKCSNGERKQSIPLINFEIDPRFLCCKRMARQLNEKHEDCFTPFAVANKPSIIDYI